MRKWYIIAMFCCGLTACEESRPETYRNLRSEGISIEKVLEGHLATVLVFLSPECPLCENYAPMLRTWPTSFPTDSVAVIGVVSGRDQTPFQVRKFKLRHEFAFELVLDPNTSLSKKYKVRVTPEVVMLDPKGEVLYQGAIDNWAITLSRKRPKATEHYLHNALEQYFSRGQVNPKYVEAVGCYIE